MNPLIALPICLFLGYAFYWCLLSPFAQGIYALNLDKPYMGHKNYDWLRAGAWLRSVSVAILMLYGWPEPNAKHPINQLAWGAILGGFLTAHIHFMALGRSWWDRRAG